MDFILEICIFSMGEKKKAIFILEMSAKEYQTRNNCHPCYKRRENIKTHITFARWPSYG